MKKEYHHASHSKYLLKYHFVFCCKYRKKLLVNAVADEMKTLFTSIAEKSGFTLLFGARVGDTLISHWGLYWTGLSDPNPGLYSTALYVAESFLIYLFAGDILLLSYILLGAAFFASVLPTLWLAGRIIPSWRI